MEKKEFIKGKACNQDKSKKFFLYLAFLVAFFLVEIPLTDIAHGAQTTGGVNWLDPLEYTKPAFVPITVPDEASCPNKYYVNMSGGSGSTCSQASPCGSIDNVMGKTGTKGGPAYIYVRGSGQWSGYNDTFYGSAGNEIVIKPWPGYTATFSANSNMNSSNIHHIIFDGGPDLGIAFTSSGSDQYNMHIIADNITIYRCRAYATTGGGMLFAVGDSRVVSNVNFINNEFYQCNQTAGYQCSSIYVGPGAGGGYSTMNIQNNIIRDMGGEAIEVNPRVTSSGMTIQGNAIHNSGKQTCSGAWGCRPGITMSVQSGGGNNSTVIKNNLIWDTGSSCIWDRGGGTPAPVIYNNTCYDYAVVGSDPWPYGISSYSNGGSAIVRNNIIYASNGTNPFDGSRFVKSNNICVGCDIGWNTGVFLSTNKNNIDFLKIGQSSPAYNAGSSVDVTMDYAGAMRPYGSAYDVGAFEYGAGGDTAPRPPSNLRIP